ncbi:hypothetical protein [Pontibacter akesuensis]|uniref:STAS domain-containing protein n=1 Tax=Pontibacter akesuensis TaxID=388950 RepID=A0A1I7IEH6_9BACT|nr:hypothetical protein [Pontibacter akesuensis]GHA66763.1 hypothetical protein GCM10007389_19790 [Pontibacter akesuensis]SFU71266.1 hypothetical protein SAMN04487941_2147 [Pontibacter akesuensis]
MQAFLYLNLTTEKAYAQPLVDQVRQTFPELAILDLDAQSDELLQHYALRLLRESERAVVSIKADETTVDLTGAMPLLEELFQGGTQRLVLLLGQHARLQRIFAARPHVVFQVVEEGEVVEEVKGYFE